MDARSSTGPTTSAARDAGGDGGALARRLEQRLRFERMIAELSTTLIDVSPERLDQALEAVLGRVGAFFGVDRAYLFRFSEDRQHYSNTHEWVADGVSREAQNLQRLPITIFPWLIRELFADRAVHVDRVAALPAEAEAERREFEREGIQSIAMVPFGEAGSPEGFIGFDAVRAGCRWTEDTVLGLKLVAQMVHHTFRAQDMARRLLHMALHDELTGLANRKLLADRIAQAVARCARTHGRAAVMLIDVDDFKLVNDSYGHSRGDELLRGIADRLRGSVREVDTVARLGGDEFVLVVDLDRAGRLPALVARLFESVSQPLPLGSETITPSMSLGVALCPDDGEDADTLLRRADIAMYSAKAAGKNRHALFSREIGSESRHTLRLRQQLRQAVSSLDVVPFYQPRVSLDDGLLLGFEALARWRHAEHGWLAPDQFLVMAAQIGVDGELDLAVLGAALDDLARWRALRPGLRLSVNLGARNLGEPAFMEALHERLARAGALVDALELEITEDAIIRDLDRAHASLGGLRRAFPGLRLALDDFGSGYSSLSYLRRLPVTTLKIDRSFVAHLHGTGAQSTHAIVRSILDLGRNLGLHVVAEGVETTAQADTLRQLGCVEAQGFLYAAPLAAEDATRLLESSDRASLSRDPGR